MAGNCRISPDHFFFFLRQRRHHRNANIERSSFAHLSFKRQSAGMLFENQSTRQRQTLSSALADGFGGEERLKKRDCGFREEFQSRYH